MKNFLDQPKLARRGNAAIALNIAVAKFLFDPFRIRLHNLSRNSEFFLAAVISLSP